MSIEEIVTNIDVRLAALESDIQPLLDAKAALLSGAPAPEPAKRRRVEAQKTVAVLPAQPEVKAETPKPVPKRKPRKSASRRKADPVPTEKLITLLTASDGLAATTLAKEAGGNVDQIRVLLKELSDAGQVRRTGERRTTRWHLVTDEDRIAARAAEIDAQSNGHANGTATARRSQWRRASRTERS
jgi:hypothetical protein